MKLTDLFLDDLEREAPGTRKVLARVPEGSYFWKPHDKAMTMGRLGVLYLRLNGALVPAVYGPSADEYF